MVRKVFKEYHLSVNKVTFFHKFDMHISLHYERVSFMVTIWLSTGPKISGGFVYKPVIGKWYNTFALIR